MVFLCLGVLSRLKIVCTVLQKVINYLSHLDGGVIYLRELGEQRQSQVGFEIAKPIFHSFVLTDS